MTADTQVKLDEVTVWVHVWLNKYGWNWAVTTTPDLPRYAVVGLVLDDEPIKSMCADSGTVYWSSSLARWLAVRQAKEAARKVAQRLAGRATQRNDVQRFTYTATWSVDDEEATP